MKKPIAGRISTRPSFRPRLESLETRLTPTTYTVSSLADSGDGSLRAAITGVNGDTSPDEIDFSVAGVIQLASALPAITNTVKIDGTTAPGGAFLPVVEIDNHGFAGLTISASGSSLIDMSVVNANGPGVTLEGDNITLLTNWIGLAVDSSLAANTGVGLFVDNSKGDTIGATTSEPNIFSGNGGGGIQLGTSSAEQFVQNATLIGNSIGTIDGPGLGGNQGNGITVFSTGNTIGGSAAHQGNTIANNTGGGGVVDGGAQNAILGNSIFSNTGAAIQLLGSGNHNQAAPVMTGSYLYYVNVAGANLFLSGTLTASPNTQYELNFFVTGTGGEPVQGQTYLISQTVTTDANGLATFTSSQVGAFQSTNLVFGATATNSTTNDTSAYSNNVGFNTTQPAFIANAYQLLLNRGMDGGAPYWVNGIATGNLTPQSAVLGIESGEEYVRDQVIAMYSHYLQRVADQDGIQYWTNFVEAGGTFEEVAGSMTGSQEYFALQGGTNQGFIVGLYRDVLNRTASVAELAGWEAALAAGVSRLDVSTAFLTSQEYRTNLVQADYLTFLKRSADSSGLAEWVNALNAGATDQQVLAQIFGSPEGYQLWS